MSFLVMDLGGTRLKAGLAQGGAISAATITDVSDASPLDVVAAAGREILSGARTEGAGLCVPGLVEGNKLVALPGKLAGLEGTDIGAFLRDVFETQRVAVTNDAVAYATGEATAGAGRDCRRSVVVTIGTGVGVTVIEDGKPATAGMFGAGILGGFIPIADATPGYADSTGETDTIEALCAAQRILDYAGESYGSVREVFEAHSQNDAARHGVERYRNALARALVALAHAHAPERIILGGGPMREGNPVMPGLEALVNKRLYGTYRVQVRLAELGDNAALIGLSRLLESR
ncbi:MAG: ROK family protein [Actinomycetota bacterium]|nr:ROK family protein [Actinomycetota bacterium]